MQEREQHSSSGPEEKRTPARKPRPRVANPREQVHIPEDKEERRERVRRIWREAELQGR